MDPEFWVTTDGQNMLAGVDGNFANPIRLTDDFIVDFLLHIPNARASLERLLPTLLPEEQDRISALWESVRSGFFVDAVQASDWFQTSLTTSGIFRGGEWIPPRT